MIHNRIWRELVDDRFEDGYPHPSSGVIYCDLSLTPQLFSKIRGSDEKYIIISPNTDWTLCLQKEHHPGRDMAKLASVACTIEYGYRGVQLPPTVNQDAFKCDPRDKYSIKCYRYTQCTFNEIPENVVHWFLTNNLVDEPRLTSIPFGVGACGGNMEYVDKIGSFDIPPWEDRINKAYLNVQHYTWERTELYKYYAQPHVEEFVTTKFQIPWDDYAKDIMGHKFVLCPNGNGIDCYRTLETIYLGAVPIVEDSYNARNLARNGFPIILHPTLKFSNWDLYNINKSVETLLKLGHKFWDHSSTTVDFWKEKINSYRKFL